MKKLFSKFFFWGVLLLSSISVARAHITPMVHLIKHNEAIKTLLAGGQSFFVKNVKIGQKELGDIRSAAHWTPDLSSYRFFYGKDSAGNLIGDALLISVNSKHGPLTLAIGFTSQNLVTAVLVTDVGIEPLPWIRRLMNKKFLDRFAGKGEGQVTEVLKEVSKKELGSMAYYYAKVIAKGVSRALVLQRVLFELK